MSVMNQQSRSDSYAAAGVDITAGYKAVELMKTHIAKTMTAGALSDIGGFGGLFALDLTGITHPVLVSGTDGVGTKLKLAFLMDQHDTVGIDCVAMCVNDIICVGAKPLFFLDYIACGKNVPEKIAQIVSGVAEGCVQSGAALIGGETAGGVYTGLGCIGLVYPELGLIPNLISCPGWSSKPTVYEAMVKAGTKVNGHWDAAVFADIPIEAAAKVGEAQVEDARVGAQAVDTIEMAIQWKNDNAYTSERSKVFWPQAMDTAGRIYHAAVLGIWRQMMVDEANGGIPMESCSNKAIPVARQYFGAEAANRGFDQKRGNELNAQGITTLVYWGGQWVLWGPHTAAYKHGQVMDNRVIFDNSIRVMMHITNSFQQEHALTIDKPMTRAMADTIRNREQEKADALAALGALIGEPVVEFSEDDNSTDDLVEGNFTWATRGTPTPPFKSGTMRVAYTKAGFNSYFGEAE